MIEAAIIAVSLSGTLTPTSAWGSTYVFTQLGPYGNPDCFGGNTIDLTMDLLLEGSLDSLICIDGTTSCQSIAEARFDLRDDGFTIKDNGWGEAVGLDINDAFSRHDINASMNVNLYDNQRIHVSWFMLSAGLSSVLFEIRRIGDIDGPDELIPPIISRSLGSYTDPVTEDGVDVLFMQAGRWRIRQASTHQAMAGSTPEFMHGFARHTHMATYVPLGDADGNSTVSVEDILLVLSQFGPCNDCVGDLDGNGVVDVTDLLQVLADFGQTV